MGAPPGHPGVATFPAAGGLPVGERPLGGPSMLESVLGGLGRSLRIVRLSLLLLVALLPGCPTTRIPPAGLHARAGGLAPLAAAATRGPTGEPSVPSVDERVARGLDRVRIMRTWRAPLADGSTDLLLDVFNGGSRPLAGLVIDLVDETVEPGATRATCHLEVWIPVGRVARASCSRPLTGPPHLVPRVVDAHWQ